ncbi:hypothetical protein DL93DRAFT_165217 [Clavulina sp. PMI_390]|nr:hypothetical protein DL93DRAFT_165217 [Clavulina sp. PMI_390]
MAEYPPPNDKLSLELNTVAGIMERLRILTSKRETTPPRSRHRVSIEPVLDGLANILTTTEHHFAVSVVYPQVDQSSYEIWVAEETEATQSTDPSPYTSPSLTEASMFTDSLFRQLASARELNMEAIRGGDLHFPRAFLQPSPILNVKGILPLVHFMAARMWPRLVRAFTMNETLRACCKVADLVTNNTPPHSSLFPSIGTLEPHLNILRTKAAVLRSGNLSFSQVVGRLFRACEMPWPDSDVERQDILWSLYMLSNIHRILSSPDNRAVVDSWNFILTSPLKLTQHQPLPPPILFKLLMNPSRCLMT